MPTNMPSIILISLLYLKASKSLHVSILSITFKFNILGIKLGPIPCILWDPNLFSLIKGLDKGSNPIIFVE